METVLTSYLPPHSHLQKGPQWSTTLRKLLVQNSFSTILPPKGSFGNVRRHFGCHNCRGGREVVCSWERPEMLLNILQCTAQAHNSYLTPNVSNVEDEKPWFRTNKHKNIQRKGTQNQYMKPLLAFGISFQCFLYDIFLNIL